MKKNKERNNSPNFNDTFKTTKYMFGFVWKEKQGKLYLLIQNIMAIINALFPIIYTVFPGLIINELLNEQRINTLIIYVGILVFTPVLSYLLNTLVRLYTSKLSMALNLKMNADFYHHVTSMDYETLENPDVQIMKDRAKTTLNSAIGVTDKLTALISAIIGLMAISVIITTLNPLIIILITIITICNSVVTKKVNYKSHLIGKELSKFDRYQWGFAYMLEHFSYAKEIRLFNLNSFLINIFTDSKKDSDKLELKQRTTSSFRDTFITVTNFVQQLALYAYIIFCVISRGLAVGSMTIYMTAAGQFSGAL